MAENKTKPTRSSVDGFLAKIADPARRADCEALATLMADVTGEPAAMWGSSIVGFGRYAYRYESGRTGESMLIGFAPRKTDLTLYVMPGLAAVSADVASLGKVKAGKGCLYLRRLDDVDARGLKALLKKAVAALQPQRIQSDAKKKEKEEKEEKKAPPSKKKALPRKLAKASR